MTTATTTQFPGYPAGSRDIDPTHSDVSFTVRHMMVSKLQRSVHVVQRADRHRW